MVNISRGNGVSALPDRKKLLAIGFVAVLLVGAFAVFGEEIMIGVANLNFGLQDSTGDESGENSMSATLAAYDADGNLVKKGSVQQSGFYLGEDEIAFIQLTVDVTFVGINIDWTTIHGAIGGLYVYPNGGEVLTDDLYQLASEKWIKNAAGEEIPDDTQYFESGFSVHIQFTIWDEDYYDSTDMPDSYKPIWYIQDIVGDPVIEEATQKAYLIQLRYHLDCKVNDLDGTELGRMVDVVGTWQLTSDVTAGSFDIIVNDEVDIDTMDPRLKDLYEDGELPITIIDKDLAPDLTIIPKDKTDLAS